MLLFLHVAAGEHDPSISQDYNDGDNHAPGLDDEDGGGAKEGEDGGEDGEQDASVQAGDVVVARGCAHGGLGGSEELGDSQCLAFS